MWARRAEVVMSGLTRVLALVLLMFGSSLPSEQTTATRAGKADLVVTRVGPAPERAAAGGSLRLSARVENRGAGRAGRSTNYYFLSLNLRKDPGDVRLVGRMRVPALGPGERFVRRVHLIVPAAVPGGSYYVVTCAEGTRRISERHESNNCRASAQRVRVTAPEAIG
jgi:hypothetical protein